MGVRAEKICPKNVPGFKRVIKNGNVKITLLCY